MKEVMTAFFMICVISTTALNLAFTFMPGQMTLIVRNMADTPAR